MATAHAFSAPHVVPTLDEVRCDPTVLDGLSVEALVDLQRQVGHISVDITAAIARLSVRSPDVPPAHEDNWLTPEEAAEKFKVTKRWLLV